jgi:hypothetical protein
MGVSKMLSDVLDRKVSPYLLKESRQVEPQKQQKQKEIRIQRDKTEKKINMPWKEIRRLFEKAPAASLTKFYSIIVSMHFSKSYLEHTYIYDIRSGEELPWKSCCKDQLFRHYYKYSSMVMSEAIELARAEGIDAEKEEYGPFSTKWIFTYRPKIHAV